MLDMLLLMVAVAASAGSGNFSVASQGSATVPPPAVVAAEKEAEATMAPTETEVEGNEVAGSSAPAFLAPKRRDTASAAPAFLAPKKQPAASPPAFLAPAAKPALVAESQIPTGRFTTATEVKPILNATRANWILVREFDGKDLLYVTQIWSWRCGLLELKVGINGNDPEVWPLPECHMDQASPAAILDSDGLPYKEFELGSIAMVEIELTYDDLTKDSAKFSRQGRLVP